MRMEPTRAAQMLSGLLASSTEPSRDTAFADGLATLTARLESGEATRVLIQSLEVEKDSNARARLADGLVAAAVRMKPTEASQFYGYFSQKLALEIAKGSNNPDRSSVASLLISLAKKANPGVSKKAMEPAVRCLTSCFEKENDASTQGDLAWWTGPLTDRLEMVESERICLPVAENLSAALAKQAGNFDERGFSLVKGLGAMMIRLPPDRAAKAVRLLATVAEATKGDMGSRTVDFYYLIGGLDPPDAARVARVLVVALDQEKDSKIRWWLAAGLCCVAERMDPNDAMQICEPAAVDMASAVATTKRSGNLNYNQYIVNGFKTTMSRIDQVHAGRAAAVLSDAVERETDAQALDNLATALSSVVDRLEPAQAARICSQALRVLTSALVNETNINRSTSLASAVSTIARHLEPIQAARTLVAALERAKVAEVCYRLAVDLSMIAGRMNKAQAAQTSGQAARQLTARLEREEDLNSLHRLAQALIAVASRMEPIESKRVCSSVVRQALRAQFGAPLDPDDRNKLSGIVSMLLSQQDGETVQACIRGFTSLIFAEADVNNLGIVGMMNGLTIDDSLATLVSEVSPAKIACREPIVAISSVQRSACFSVPSAIVAAVCLAAQPFACRLTTQELVELLKMPTCFGPARRVVLDHLGNRYGHGVQEPLGVRTIRSGAQPRTRFHDTAQATRSQGIGRTDDSGSG